MNKRRIHLLYFLALLLLFSAFPVQAKSGKTEKSTSALPEFIWMNSTKMQVKKFGKEKTEQLLWQIAATQKAENEVEKELPEQFWSICLKYEDGRTEGFCFFSEESGWYMKMGDDKVFCNAEFAGEYFPDSSVETAKSGGTYEAEIQDWNEADEMPKVLESQFPVHDFTWYYATQRRKLENSGNSKEDAKRYVRKNMQRAALIYYYAVDHGYTCTTEEIEAAKAERLERMNQVEQKDALLERLEEKVGCSYEEYLEKSNLILSGEILYEKLYQQLFDAFRFGNDQIGDVVCDSFSEYWMEFLQQEVYDKAERQILNEIDQRTTNAELRYLG